MLRACIYSKTASKSPDASLPDRPSPGEAALSVSPEVFEQMCEDGEFAMHWQANGLQYGIPVQVNEWLSSGRHVLVNGSRGYLPEARRRYPNLLAIRLEVAPQVLRERLLTRGGSQWSRSSSAWRAVPCCRPEMTLTCMCWTTRLPGRYRQGLAALAGRGGRDRAAGCLGMTRLEVPFLRA